jgi:GYF domain 2
MSDQWHYTLKGETFGPVPFEIVAELAADGILEPDDTLRRDRDKHWFPADSILGLFPEGIHSSGDASREDFATLDDLEQWSQTEQTEWFCRTFDADLGPMALDELERLVRDGRVTRSDGVRRGDESVWVRAGQVRELFAAFRALEREAERAEALPIAEPPPKQKQKRKRAKYAARSESRRESAVVAGRAKYGREESVSGGPRIGTFTGGLDVSPYSREPAAKSVSDRNRVPDWERVLLDGDPEPSPAPRPAPEPVSEPARSTSPVSVPPRTEAPAPEPAVPAVAPPRPLPTMPVYRPPASKRERRSFDNPFEGNGKKLVLGGAAAIAVVVVGFLSYRMFFGYSSGDAYESLMGVATEFRELRKKGASDDEFDALRNSANNQLTPIIASVQKNSSMKPEIKREFVSASAELFQMMKDARKRPSVTERKFDQRMKHLKDNRVPPTTPARNKKESHNF